MSKDLEQLQRLAQAVLDRDLAELAKRQIRRRGAQLARSDFLEREVLENAAALDDLDYRRLQEGHRKFWRAQRSHALTFEEARAAAEVEIQRKITAKSFGRAMVLDKLSKR